MVKVMYHVAERQGFKIPDDGDVAREIAQDANGNMRKALLVFEALKMQRCLLSSIVRILENSSCSSVTLTGPLTIAKPDWETYCQKVGDMIIQEQTPQRVMEVRAKLYELLSHCIPPTVILKVHFIDEKPNSI